MSDETKANALTHEDQARAAYFDPDVSVIQDATNIRFLELADEVKHLRASARHWRDRALQAEPLAARSEQLQTRVNDLLAEQAAAQSLNGQAHADTPREGAKP